MPIVKSVSDMLEKYSSKYDGANVTTVITAIKTLMDSAYQGGATPIFNVVERVRSLLDSLGVPSTMWGLYISFAERLQAKAFSFSGETLAVEASALKQEWVTAHGADGTILDQVANLILGATPPY